MVWRRIVAPILVRCLERSGQAYVGNLNLVRLRCQIQTVFELNRTKVVRAESGGSREVGLAVNAIGRISS